MRALILSDIHSNLEAFDAVLAHARANGGWDVIWFLGDLVGYGADPGPCIARLRSHPHLAVAGNHDHAVTGQLNPDRFNSAARAAALWTAARLATDELRWLAGWPEIAPAGEGDFTLVHGSLRDPIMEYLISAPAARATFARQQTPFCLVGHSHYPLVWTETRGDSGNGNGAAAGAEASLLDTASPLPLRRGRRQIINPGSVGQPRDGDWRASYILYDSAARHNADTAATAAGTADAAGIMEHRRVEYDIAAAQAKIRAAGLPAILAERLAEGR